MRTRGWLASAAIELGLSWKYRIWAGLLTGAALLVCRLPLFGVLGFEFSFVMAILASLAGADLGASLVHRARHHQSPPVERLASPGDAVRQLLIATSGLCMLLLVAPAVIISVNALWVRNCDWLFGLRCFLLLPCLSAVLASGLGVCVGVLGIERKWLRLAMPYAALLLGLVLSLVHFYRSPAVFSYNPFVGYFPGNLYDESIDLQPAFYWARLYHLALLSAALCTAGIFVDVSTLRLARRAKPSAPRLRLTLMAMASAALAALLFLESGPLRFQVSAGDIREALPGRYESEHFIIHYPADPTLTENIAVIAADHEFRRAQVVRELGVDPPGKITSYYFASPEQKYELMGARNVYMAKPWRHEIYVQHQDFPHPVLRHEIAHVLAGAFGDAIFEVSAGTLLGLPVHFNIGMIEGTAVAADWPGPFTSALTPHQSVKAMQALGLDPPANRLFSTGFLAFSSAQSYTLAGSYLRFLLDRYGIDRLQRLYKSGGDFQEAYGRPQAALTQEWQAHIDATTLPIGAAEIIREQFRRPAIFDRPCPHAIARARDRMSEQAAQGEFSAAIHTAQGVCSDVPAEPTYQLQLAALYEMASRIDDASAIYTRVSDDAEHISSTLRAYALFELVNIRMSERKETQAMALLERIIDMPVGDDDLRRAQIQLQVLRHEGPAAEALRGVFWSTRPGREVDRMVVAGLAAEAASLEPSLGLSHYLLGRLMGGHGNPDATRRALGRALQDESLSALTRRETARLLAEASFLADNAEDLRRACAILVQPDQPEVLRLLGYDWLERLYFRQTGRVPDRALGWDQGLTLHGMRSIPVSSALEPAQTEPAQTEPAQTEPAQTRAP